MLSKVFKRYEYRIVISLNCSILGSKREKGLFYVKYLPDIGEGCVLPEFHAADRKKIEKGQAGDCIDDSVHRFL